MMELSEFLLARISEDEERGANCRDWMECNDDYGCPAHMAPVRWAAECDAKRRIVERYRVCETNYDEGNRLEARVLDWTMRLLALSYAEHPSYDGAWRL